MFSNLKAEMARTSILIKDFANDEDISLSPQTLTSRFNGTTEWTKKEMWTIKKKYFPDKSIEYLFEQDTDK